MFPATLGPCHGNIASLQISHAKSGQSWIIWGTAHLLMRVSSTADRLAIDNYLLIYQITNIQRQCCVYLCLCLKSERSTPAPFKGRASPSFPVTGRLFFMNRCRLAAQRGGLNLYPVRRNRLTSNRSQILGYTFLVSMSWVYTNEHLHRVPPEESQLGTYCMWM